MSSPMIDKPTTKLIIKTIIILSVFLGIAIILNLFVLDLFNQKSIYRAEHSLVGIVMLMGFFVAFSNIADSFFKTVLLFFIALIPCYIGTVFSDLDIRLLGIGGHRNPLFHSGLLFYFMLIVCRKNNSVLLATIIAAFGIGLGSHLVWDFFDYGDVRWIPGRAWDLFWLGSNGVLCFVFAKTSLTSRSAVAAPDNPPGEFIDNRFTP